tara:strand:+ start:488 stop:928 length:441 start_codon:yes stop_codon:yes gene_type:complete
MLALLAWPLLGAIVNRVVGPNNTEITHGSAVGGFQVFLRGKDLGTSFNPPTILLGSSGLSTCSVHPTSHGGVTRLKGFTSSSTMLKCIVDATNLPLPPDAYDAAGSFITLPLYVVKDGRHCRPSHCRSPTPSTSRSSSPSPSHRLG